MTRLSLMTMAAWGADVTGKWTFNVETAAGNGSPTFVFKQTGEKLTGTYHGQFGEAALTGTVKGDKVEFTFGMEPLVAKYSGSIEGGTKMSGTCDYGEAAGKGKFTATKN